MNKQGIIYITTIMVLLLMVVLFYRLKPLSPQRVYLGPLSTNCIFNVRYPERTHYSILIGVPVGKEIQISSAKLMLHEGGKQIVWNVTNQLQKCNWLSREMLDGYILTYSYDWVKLVEDANISGNGKLYFIATGNIPCCASLWMSYLK